MQIESAGIQVLESVYLIATSKNIDTIISRYDFVLDRISLLKHGQNHKQYPNSIQAALERYKETYNDRPLQDYQISILSNPGNFNINDFYCSSLANAMKRYCSEQTKEINSMKKESAKSNRKEKVITSISKTRFELHSKCSSSPFYSVALSELNDLEQTYKSIL
jgi:hypothetical protein